MINDTELGSIGGANVYDQDGDKVGKVGQIYFDDDTGRPEWVTVNTGFFGTSESFVPLRDVTFEDDAVRAPYAKSMIKDAPRIDPTSHLDPDEEDTLYSYYGIQGGVAQTTTGTAATDVSSGRDDAMTRSEEELRVGTQHRAKGKARLRKYVTTEQQTVTVPVSREEVRVEREPITDANVDEALQGPAISESEHEVTLHEEVPVVSTEAKPKERVRLETEKVTDTERVSGEVRKEHIDVEGDADHDDRV